MRLYTILLSVEDRERIEYLRHLGKFNTASEALRALLKAWSDVAKKNNERRELDI